MDASGRIITHVLGGYSVEYNLNSYALRVKKYLDFARSEGLKNAAEHVRDLAHERMFMQWNATNKNYPIKKNRDIRPRLAEALFGGRSVPVIKIDQYSYQIKIVKDIDLLELQYPHLVFQEEGVKRNIHSQAFLIVGRKKLKNGKTINKLGNIKESNVGHYAKNRIYRMSVSHPQLKARHFIKAGMMFLKTEGGKTVLSYIRERLK